MFEVLDVRRCEMKYRISTACAGRLRQLIAQVLPADEHNGNGKPSYLVRSLYFDSMIDSDLSDKINGLETRKKIRLRIYSHQDTVVKLEIKQKDGNWQRKQSVKLSKKDALLLIQGDYSPLLQLNQSLAERLYHIMTQDTYRPKCIVEYQRSAFVVPTNDTRITFDTHLSATESCYDLFAENLALYPVGWLDDVTLEVKYNHFMLSYVRDLLESVDKTSVSYSKYVMSRYMSHYTV
ncbi:polyphosphate polymerase domain-containing protein [Lachnospiraceae bacterium ZAX-1]